MADRLISRQRILALCLLLVFSLLPCACTTQDPTTLIGPWRGERFQEVGVDLSSYRNVQDRVGGQDGSLAVAVAISGGGHRAGNFAAGVLLGLEQYVGPSPSGGDALREVDYLSTVSGGGLAAAAYVSSLHDYQAFGGTSDGYSFAKALYADARAPLERQATDPELRHGLEYNYVSDIVRGAFALGTLGSIHRGDFLENSFDDHILGRLWRERKLRSMGLAAASRDSSLRLGDVFIPSGAGRDVRLPYWVANATTYENAAIFCFTPEHLKLYKICGYKHRLARHATAATGPAYDAFTEQVPLALGLTASGNFPVAIPATTLQSRMDPKNPYLHLIDGGEADMFGVTTALRMLRQDRAARKVLIVIDAYNGPVTPFSNCAQSPGAFTMGGRMTVAFLDAYRARCHETIRSLCRSRETARDIEVVFLCFDDLLDGPDMAALAPYGFAAADLAQLKLQGVTPGTPITPFALARDVWTWYDISSAEQKLLLAVGRCVVDRKKDEIRKALGWQPATASAPAIISPTAPGSCRPVRGRQ